MNNDAHTGPAPLVANDTPKFGRGDVVRHMATFRMYLILQGPPLAVDEATGLPGYVYRSVDNGADPRWWFRSMHEMERAGKFDLVKKSTLVT